MPIALPPSVLLVQSDRMGVAAKSAFQNPLIVGQASRTLAFPPN